MRIVFVGFKVKQDRSVMYKKMELEEKTVFGKMSINAANDMGKVLEKAIEKGCDFVSIRFIK